MRLIIVDGLDAVGKDTHAKLIFNRYKKIEENVNIRSHPSDDNFFGRKAKKALLKKSPVYGVSWGNLIHPAEGGLCLSKAAVLRPNATWP